MWLYKGKNSIIVAIKIPFKFSVYPIRHNKEQRIFSEVKVQKKVMIYL